MNYKQDSGFRWLLLLSALGMSSVTGYLAVLGFTANFGNAPMFFAMGACLEVGKLVTVSYLHRYGRATFWLWRYTATLFAITLVAISSFGIFGFLTSNLEQHLQARRAQTEVVARVSTEVTHLQERLAGLDDQLKNLPSEYVKSRVKLYNAYKDERDQLAASIHAKQVSVQDAQTKLDAANKHVGTFNAIAGMLGISVENTLFCLALLITLIFDPLAIAQFLFYNVARDQYLSRRELATEIKNSYEAAEVAARETVNALLQTEIPALVHTSTAEQLTEWSTKVSSEVQARIAAERAEVDKLLAVMGESVQQYSEQLQSVSSMQPQVAEIMERLERLQIEKAQTTSLQDKEVIEQNIQNLSETVDAFKQLVGQHLEKIERDAALTQEALSRLAAAQRPQGPGVDSEAVRIEVRTAMFEFRKELAEQQQLTKDNLLTELTKRQIDWLRDLDTNKDGRISQDELNSVHERINELTREVRENVNRQPGTVAMARVV